MAAVVWVSTCASLWLEWDMDVYVNKGTLIWTAAQVSIRSFGDCFQLFRHAMLHKYQRYRLVYVVSKYVSQIREQGVIEMTTIKWKLDRWIDGQIDRYIDNVGFSYLQHHMIEDMEKSDKGLSYLDNAGQPLIALTTFECLVQYAQQWRLWKMTL